MKQIIVPTGYMGSGSSAVTDLLSEVKEYSCENGSYEYVFLNCPNGLFDLEDKLLRGNNSFRSDEALHSFYNCMRQLHFEKNCWMTDYKHKIGEKFITYCDEFLRSIVDEVLPDNFWYYQELPNRQMVMKKYIGKFISRVTLGKIKPNPVLKYRDMWLSYPSKEEFYDCAKRFLNNIFELMGGMENNLILDQLILPHNLYRVGNYFDDNVKIIVVDRDPRDVFLLNKYYWKKIGVPVPFAYDVESFCKQYKKMRECENIVYNKNILRIHFEDIVYSYEKTISEIFLFLKIEEKDHIYKKTKLVPEKSKKNTQLFVQNNQFEKEAEYIEQNLAKYIYSFPRGEIGKMTNKDIIL
ncbi:sulfotransferase domain-containing protein [Clostridiaceae bacterium Marseille-Q4145]|nr:sulfotransferase domain-containing protein [Clostridiaceae bacterium Marseille-Q4145]